MKMVASAKLHKAQAAIENMLPYERRLNQQLVVLTSPVDSHCRYRIHITAELGESLQFAILCLIDLQCTCHPV